MELFSIRIQRTFQLVSTFLLPQTDDAPGYPDVQADGQAVLLQERGSGRFPHGGTYLVTGGNCGGSRPLPCRTEVSNFFIQPKNKL